MKGERRRVRSRLVSQEKMGIIKRDNEELWKLKPEDGSEIQLKVDEIREMKTKQYNVNLNSKKKVSDHLLIISCVFSSSL